MALVFYIDRRNNLYFFTIIYYINANADFYL